MAIIASILGILLFILAEVVPMLRGAKVEQRASWAWPAGESPTAFLVDEHRTRIVTINDAGELLTLDAATGREIARLSLTEEREELAQLFPLTSIQRVPGQPVLFGLTTDLRIVAFRIDWETSFSQTDERTLTAVPSDPAIFEFSPKLESPPLGVTMQLSGDGSGLAVAATEDHLLLAAREVEENLFSGEMTVDWSFGEQAIDRELQHLLIDSERRNLFLASKSGELAWWKLRGNELQPSHWTAPERPISAMSLLIGDRSLVVGRADGALEIWFPVRESEDDVAVLTLIRQFDAFDHGLVAITPSMRNKGFFAATEAGELGLFHSTSERTLWLGKTDRAAKTLLFSPKANGLYLSDGTELSMFDIDNPHPEVSIKALFGKVWYESYPEPTYVWQSSGGSDDFEPKLSMVPLMIGTLKGTIYSLFLAIPLGVFGAMFTSQFLHPSLKRFIKPAVEVMAALPSVVLGFLAGLWLAPRVEQFLPAIASSIIVVPLSVLISGLLWKRLPSGFRGRFRPGSEIVVYLVVIAASLLFTFGSNDGFERLFFGGNTQQWLLDWTGLPYDQRNALVVGLAMGFAVIPIIFSIAEDAFSNVPNNLISGSLALGANRWQTVTRVVLPTASPGIFSAIMIGFGRAVGETMIVLMATGNTPVLDWNAFNGFRTLSANIAVEIPEAPQGGTLYRALFLAAVMLFAFTFIINTIAEIVRQRLRRRYAEL